MAQLKLDTCAKELVRQILSESGIELEEDEDEQDDKLLLSLVASTPNCLAQERTEITFDVGDIAGIDFEEFHDGTLMDSKSYKELLEYTKQSEWELRDLAQKLVIRAELMRQVTTLIEA